MQANKNFEKGYRVPERSGTPFCRIFWDLAEYTGRSLQKTAPGVFPNYKSKYRWNSAGWGIWDSSRLSWRFFLSQISMRRSGNTPPAVR